MAVPSSASRSGMANRSVAPYVAPDPALVDQMLSALNDHVTTGKKSGRGRIGVRKKTFDLGDGSGRTVDSWQMNDWDYKKPNLPTYARGLFTHKNRGISEIVVRGYDKFFNVDEVTNTKWHNIETRTRGPYELSVKENGCIIFIAGLDNQTLLVTSKHSMGPRTDGSANHARAGEKWIERQLETCGKTKADLAQKLRSLNVTAIAELCDDEFEEHVLEYGPKAAGLYLHGMNLNTPDFVTYPGNLVHDFADEWGFRKVQFVMKSNIHEVKEFLDKVAETGHYEGRDTEGFVVRCQTHEQQGPQEDWFFKYKFEEPYLMYRQWREATKAIIAGKEPRFKKHKKITQEYLLYAQRKLHKFPGLGQQYNRNHGIIAMREGFLQEKGVKGSDIIQAEIQSGEDVQNAAEVTHDVVLVPVATLGCGKTTIALALSKLFKWGHEQNDNVSAKGNRPARFAEACKRSLADHPVIIADRNNHQRREREQIIADISKVVPDAKFVALHYVHDRNNMEQVRSALRERILARGDNHQTIQAGTKAPAEIFGIMDGFLGRFEPLNPMESPDDGFDVVIDLDILASSRENLDTIVKRLHESYPKLFAMPSEADLDAAIEWALNYRPAMRHDLSKKAGPAGKQKQNGVTAPSASGAGQKKPVTAEFFCIKVEPERVNAILGAVFSSESPEVAKFYQQLKSTGRTQSEFHVTLIHRAAASQNSEYWATLNSMWQEKIAQNRDAAKPGTHCDVELGKARVQLDRVAWDSRVMAVMVRLPDAEQNDFHSVNPTAHITVGTAADSIKPKESNALLAKWIQGDPNVKDIKVQGNVVLDGIVRGIAAR